MANKKETIDDKPLLHRMFDAAKASGETTRQTVKVLVDAHLGDWSGAAYDARILLFAIEYKLGRIAGIMECDREGATKIAGKKALKPGRKVTDDTRNEREQRAYQAAISAWSTVCALAGKPSAPKGARKVKASTANITPAADHSVGLKAVALPKVADVADCVAFCKDLSAMLLRFETQNAKAAYFGEYRSMF